MNHTNKHKREIIILFMYCNINDTIRNILKGYNFNLVKEGKDVYKYIIVKVGGS